MNLESGHIYHIYNQGNNRQKIFFNRENYLFFLKKINNHILPFADILAWCLMPNHFHIMAYINRTENNVLASPGATLSRARTIMGINKSIGIMLASYTRAVNEQENRSGSLFRKETKAINLTQVNDIAPAWYTSLGVTFINISNPELQYPNICFNYIVNNPVKDGLVASPEEWEFSSYPDFIGLRNGKLINREKIKEFGLTLV